MVVQALQSFCLKFTAETLILVGHAQQVGPPTVEGLLLGLWGLRALRGSRNGWGQANNVMLE